MICICIYTKKIFLYNKKLSTYFSYKTIVSICVSEILKVSRVMIAVVIIKITKTL